VIFFYKIKEQEDGTDSAGGGGGVWHQWEGEGGREKGRGKYGANTVHTCMQIQK
jgi:hypothetical protein